MANNLALAEQAAAFARGRPDYPEAAEDWLRVDLGIGEGSRALDLGSGTGKFLPRLLATGADVLAVEPLGEMRRHLTARFPDVEAVAGTAQAIPLPDGSVDAVICAQCFHLFATSQALSEIRRVLKPGGALGLIWNIRDARVPWVAEIIEIMAPYDTWPPGWEAMAWRKAFPAVGFGPLAERQFQNLHKGPPETVIVDRVLSVSAIAELPPAERESVVAQLRALIARTPELAGRPQVSFPNVTYAYGCPVSG
ncbi:MULTISPECIES: class I SAM-dependent methyltransferase [Rhodomicrobium]|uniref:class I SAM-dependent methyltransferase n=1 Tax=Rhodomicrobium TaxID=1068 RepID=UPI000B4C1BE3|nr:MULTISPECIES: class I SAM-dependent methyltransferase [Rhodomicrobium]